MKTYDSSHPFWSILRLIVVLVALTVILWMTASQFDKTELQTIIGAFAALAGAEGVVGMLTGRGGHKSNGN